MLSSLVLLRYSPAGDLVPRQAMQLFFRHTTYLGSIMFTEFRDTILGRLAEERRIAELQQREELRQERKQAAKDILFPIACVVVVIGILAAMFFIVAIRPHQTNSWGGQRDAYEVKEATEFGGVFDKDTAELIGFTYDFDKKDLSPNEEYVVFNSPPIDGYTLDLMTLNGEVVAYGNAYQQSYSVSLGWLKEQDIVTLYNQLIQEGNRYDIGGDISPLGVVLWATSERINEVVTNGLTPVPQVVLTGEEVIKYDKSVAALFATGVSAADAQVALQQSGTVVLAPLPSTDQIVEYDFNCGTVQAMVSNRDDIRIQLSELTGLPVESLDLSGTSTSISVATPEPCGFTIYEESLPNKSWDAPTGPPQP